MDEQSLIEYGVKIIEKTNSGGALIGQGIKTIISKSISGDKITLSSQSVKKIGELMISAGHTAENGQLERLGRELVSLNKSIDLDAATTQRVLAKIQRI